MNNTCCCSRFEIASIVHVIVIILGRAKETFSKKEKEKKKVQKARHKEAKRIERKNNAVDGNNLSLMMAYVDEDGNIVDTPPEPKPIPKAS